MDTREIILAKTIGYILEHGIIGFSVRSLGTSIGTSDRMILYYFQKKELLLMESVSLVAQQIIQAAQARFRDEESKSPALFIKLVWDLFADPENWGATRLFYEIDVMVLREPDIFRPIALQLMTDWNALLEDGLIKAGIAKKKAAPMALNIGSELVGLFLMYKIGGDEFIEKPLRSLMRRANEARKITGTY